MEQFNKLLEEPLVQVLNVPLNLMLVIQAVGILLVAIVLSRVLTRLVKRNLTRISVGLREIIARILHYMILTLGLVISLQHMGIDLTALAAVSAVIMVGIGVGLQNIASNFISGLVLLFERSIQVGDFVEVKGVLGTVKAINARSITVDSQDNISIIVPNSYFITEHVTNWSYRDQRSRIHVKSRTSLDVDVELVEQTLLEVGRSHPEVLGDPGPKVQLYEIGDFAFNFDLLVWIEDPRRQFFIASDLHFAIVGAFRQKGIQIPVPQQDLHLRSATALQISDNNTKP